MNNGFQHLFDSLACLRAHRNRVGRIESNGLLNRFLGAHDVG